MPALPTEPSTSIVAASQFGLTPAEIEGLRQRNAKREARFARITLPLRAATILGTWAALAWILCKGDREHVISVQNALDVVKCGFASLVAVALTIVLPIEALSEQVSNPKSVLGRLYARVLGIDPRPALYEAALRAQNASRLRLEREFWTNLSGAAFEREVAALLRRLGHTVREIGGAGDEGIDLWRDSTPVQCKQHTARIAPHVVREFLGACQGAGSSPGLIVTCQGATSAAADFARRAGVEIWTVDTLVGLARQADGRFDAPVEPDAPKSGSATEALKYVVGIVLFFVVIVYLRSCGDR